LVASPRIRSDARATLEFATNCLWTLRGIEPKLSIPLGTDTLARSVLDFDDPSWRFENLLLRTMLNLADAVGSFHRDFGDLTPARDYYRLALKLADLANLDWPDHDLLRLARNIRVFVGGSSDISNSNRLVQVIGVRTGYPVTLHEQLHVRQWDYRQHFAGKLPQRRRASEKLLETIELLKGLYFDDTLVRGASFTEPFAEIKAATFVSRWDLAEMSCLIGDAYATLGEGDRHGHYCELAREEMRRAASLQREGHFAVPGLALPRVFKALLPSYRNDPSFVFKFREPAMLKQKCWRTGDEGRTFQFSNLSRRLMEKIGCWIGADLQVRGPSVREIQAILG
jgi:hypothetical protein